MNRKYLISSIIAIPALVGGGLWFYQANLFENSLSQQLSHIQETLKTYGASLKYDELRVSKFLFQAHLFNPTISGVIPKLSDINKDLKDNEGLDKIAGSLATLSFAGEVIVSFSPVANTIMIENQGETKLNSEGPLEFNMTMPKPKVANIVIHRKEYDLFGKHPFLSIQNIECLSSHNKDITLFLNDQKFVSIPDRFTKISLDWKNNDLDVALSDDTRKMEFYKIEKGIKGTFDEVEAFNVLLLTTLEKQSILGPEDLKLSATVHVSDFASCIDSWKNHIFSDSKQPDAQVFEKLFPVGLKLKLHEYSIVNNIYNGSLMIDAERSVDHIPLKISGNIKFTEQWPTYWQFYFESLIQNINKIAALNRTDEKPLVELTSILSGIAKTSVLQLQSFGNIGLSLNVQVPTNGQIAGKGTLELKSDPYDIGLEGKLKENEGSLTIKTRNASTLMADLENYVTRVALPFAATNPYEVQNINGFLKGGRIVLERVLEPNAAVQQSVNITMNQEGFKIGNFDFAQILAMFGQGMASAAPSLIPNPTQGSAINP